ncbi:MAG TPA: glycine zipper domain-containing protein [Thermoanaerobaculia bacterium]
MIPTRLRLPILSAALLLAAVPLLLAGCGRDEPAQLATGAPYGTQDAALYSQPPAPLSTELDYDLAEAVPELPDQVIVSEDPSGAERASVAERERNLQEREAELARREREAALAARERSAARAAAEPAPERTADYDEPAERPVRRASSVTVPAGTTLEVELLETVSSQTSQVGDSVRARVSGSVHEDGVNAIPAGSEVIGVVSDAQALRRVGGRARLAIDFTELVLPSGQTVPISASYSQIGKSETAKDAATIGAGAAAGGILGKQIEKDRRGTVIGAIVGAAAGTAIAAKTKGRQVTLPAGTSLSVSLQDSVTVRR